MERLKNPDLKEVILATGFTSEGETTAVFLSEILKNSSLKISRIARGVPMGSELEHVDASTVAWAFLDRKEVLK